MSNRTQFLLLPTGDSNVTAEFSANKGTENVTQLRSGKAAHPGAGPGTAPGLQGDSGCQFWGGGLAFPGHPKFLGKLGQAQLQAKFSPQVSLATAASPAKSQHFHIS